MHNRNAATQERLERFGIKFGSTFENVSGHRLEEEKIVTTINKDKVLHNIFYFKFPNK